MAPSDARELLRYADLGGAERGWLERVGDQLLEEALELAELRRCVDPRRLASIEKAHRVRHALDAGATPAQVRARFRLGRSALYRALQLSREVRDALPVGSPHRSNRRRTVS